MADDKSGKQATLGYVRDSQMTIGCVHLVLARAAPVGLDMLQSVAMITADLLTPFFHAPQEILRLQFQWQPSPKEADYVVIWWKEINS